MQERVQQASCTSWKAMGSERRSLRLRSVIPDLLRELFQSVKSIQIIEQIPPEIVPGTQFMTNERALSGNLTQNCSTYGFLAFSTLPCVSEKKEATLVKRPKKSGNNNHQGVIA